MRPQLLATIGFACFLCASGASFAAEPKTEEEKALYALGMAVSQTVAAFNLTEAELELVKSGFSDGALGKTSKVDTNTYLPKLREMQSARTAAAGKATLDKAAAEKGAQRTASGLVVTTIKEGQGAAPQASDTVKVHYHGTLPNGKVFDSTVGQEPVSFALNGVIPCWTEGLQLMKVGGKTRLVCPAALAYGERGVPPQIPPGATLIFEVELLEIQKPAGKP